MKKRRHQSPDRATVVYELLETWRCLHCGKKFRRKIPLSTPLGPPRGFQLHSRACYRKAKAFDLEVAP